MHPLQKKISAFGLVLLLAIPLIFSVVILVQQKALQVNSPVKFDTEIIQTITIQEKNVNWVKKGKEILFNGKLFDVKSYRTDGENVLLSGYYDHKEDKLVELISKLFQKKNKSESPINQVAVKFLFFQIFTPQNEFTITAYWKLTDPDLYSYTEEIPEAPFRTFSPPPEL